MRRSGTDSILPGVFGMIYECLPGFFWDAKVPDVRFTCSFQDSSRLLVLEIRIGTPNRQTIEKVRRFLYSILPREVECTYSVAEDNHLTCEIRVKSILREVKGFAWFRKVFGVPQLDA